MSEAQWIRALDARLEEPLADANASGDGIGFVGPDVPVDVLLASGRTFGHLPWLAGAPTPWADQWLESSFPFWSRSILEQWHTGVFDGLDTVVFSRADDASQRLYYYVAELRRGGKLAGPMPLLFDIALIERESSLAHSESAVVDLMRSIDVSEDALVAGIERGNRLRRQFTAIEASRTAAGPLYERLWRAALWTDPTPWIDEFCAPVADCAAERILLAGSMPPDGRIHEAIESAGASVVAEAHAGAPMRLGPALVPGSEPPERAIAQHLRRNSIAPRAFLDRSRWIVERACAARAAGVVLWLTREEEALAWAVPAQVSALAAAGIPSLVLSAARWQADDDAAARITDFCRRSASATA